jgi:serine/threonine protein kinase
VSIGRSEEKSDRVRSWTRLDTTDFLHGPVCVDNMQLQDPDGAVEVPTVVSNQVGDKQAFPPVCIYMSSIQALDVIDSVGTGRHTGIVLVTTTEMDLRVDITKVQGEMQWYELTRKVADCIYGEVWHALQLERVVDTTLYKYIEPYKEIAIKALFKSRMSNQSTYENPEDEIAAMQFLGSRGGNRYLIEYIGAYQDQGNVYSLMEYHHGGELYGAVCKRPLSQERSRRYLIQTVEGLRYCHSHGVAHKDMSLENILYVREGQEDYVKIIDFGMCLRVPRHENGSFLYVTPQGACGKKNYMAPEVVQNRHAFDPMKSDIWALGVILFTMLCGFPPCDVAHPNDRRYQMIAQGFLPKLVDSWGVGGNLESSTPETGPLDLIQRILKPNPGDRLTLDQILNHRWVREEGNGGGNGVAMPPSPPTEVHEGSTMTTDEAVAVPGTDEANGNGAVAMET